MSTKREMREKRQSNISPQLLVALTEVFKKEPTPEKNFCYIYANFYSSLYRTKYAEFLRTDFPRVPFTKDYKLFCEMAKYGKELVDLHLLKSDALDQPIVRFQGKGDNKVEKLKYAEDMKNSPSPPFIASTSIKVNILRGLRMKFGSTRLEVIRFVRNG